MIVTACLIWWEEKPEDLRLAVEGAATIADRIVAVDGAYARYPGATVRSPIEQMHEIEQAAFDKGLQPMLFWPQRLWSGQVEKRAFALAEAARDSDWVAVLDTDWRISGNREEARAFLEGTDADVVSAPFYTVPNPGREVASGWHSGTSGGTVQMAHLYRTLPELTCERHHWCYSALKDGERVWLWGGDDPTRRLIPQVPIEADYRIEHLTLHRSEEQVLASRAFLNDRIMVINTTGQEDDRPDLPRPVWDYDTVPYT